MTRTRTRSLFAGIAVAAVLGYGLAGHSVPQMSSHDGMAGATAGLCLLLAAALGCIVARRPQTMSFPLATISPAPPIGQPRPAPDDGRARASPKALQRFRN